ncbi:protein-disulfide reductase DsbD family protein [Litoreibacter arenae]|uniref:Cytochrome c-type biogenesis protein DsbD, protein-disulfide reductase n=1 Tax=Litoreibacter arenae DSM 19593 TaxID=1123360 RepID=S9QDD3_9RHOB|nr:protein-disulfide reductase DsbD domain-containing protein [Litoreibacter arenae]EPX79441.1 Cytochrome c-type biogenesis protein DsbD, protein-disulfide reductase [Litoreibacter arenae DSM 19593]
MRILASLIVIWLSAALSPVLAASSPAYQSERITARLITAENTVTPDAGTISAGLQIELADGWKTYWKAPGSVGYPPELDWSASANVGDTELLFPAPTRFEAFDIENYGYEKEVTFPVQLTLDQAGGTAVLNVSANVLVCAELCIPEMFDLSLTLLAGEGGIDTASAALIADAAAKVPAALDDAGMSNARFWWSPDASELQVAVDSSEAFGADLQVFPDMGPDAAFGAPVFELAGDRKSIIARLPVLAVPDADTPLEITLRDGDRAARFDAATPSDGPLTAGTTTGLWSIAVIALLGGLILNIMPCVLPVLTIKFASALKSSDQSAARIRTGFVVSALGVLTFMWALAVVLLAIRAGGGQIGWGVQFQNPVFLGLMITLISVFAANMAGLFEITLPQRLNTSMARMEHGQGLLGDFATGALAAVLATPCSAPFLGTAVTFALAGSGFEAMVIFTALGLGLASPYLAVALRPSLVQALPKPGPWMVRVKWVMAALLALTALWLASVMVTVAGWVVVLVLLALIAAAVLAMLARKNGRMVAAALIVAAVFAPVVLRPAPQAIAQSADWATFDEASIGPAVARGEVVFVDVTASWCLTCKANKARVLDRDPVAELLTQDGVTAMRGDWTQPDPAILAYLQSNGRFGIPFNKVYGPGAPEGIALPEFLTKDAVLSALETARP